MKLSIKWCIFIKTLRPRQNGYHFPEDIFKCIFLNENKYVSIKNSQTFVCKVLINNIPALVQIMAWHRPSTKPLSAPIIFKLLTHICLTQPRLVDKIVHTVELHEAQKCQIYIEHVSYLECTKHTLYIRGNLLGVYCQNLGRKLALMMRPQ